MSAKYDRIGINYNYTRKADPYLVNRLIHHLQPRKKGLYLDIGCGTGNYTNALQKKGFRFIGIDPSDEMLNKARQQNTAIEWRLGFAELTGLDTESIDGIIATLTIHHWPDLYQSFKELSRILKPNGRIVIFTSTPQQMQGYWLNHYFPKMLQASMLQMPSFETVQESMKAANLNIVQTEQYDIQPDLEDLFLYSGKHKPELYLNHQVRNGISSFSALADAEEVDQGLQQLQKDISSGNITDIMQAYHNSLGNYLYLIGQK